MTIYKTMDSNETIVLNGNGNETKKTRGMRITAARTDVAEIENIVT